MILILEILRGLAALWVFLLHVKDDIFLLDNSTSVYHFLSMGYLGVPMFFVISGYVIAYSAESHIAKNKSPFVFIKKRLWRIYPTLWFSIILIILLPLTFELLSFIKSGSFSFPQDNIIENAERYSIFEWINVVLLTKIFWQQYDKLSMEFSGVNTVFWSLGIEVQFYFIVCIMMFFKTKFRFLTILLSILSLLSILFSTPINKGLFLSFWLPFSFGIFLAYIIKSSYFQNLKLGGYYLIALLVFYFAMLTTFFNFYTPQDMTKGTEFANIAFSFLFAIGLLVIYPLEKQLSVFQSTKIGLIVLWPFLILGAMSYTVYLLHTKLYVVATSFSKYIFQPYSLGFGITTIIITLIFCFPIYYFVERRFMSSNLKSIHKH